MRGHIEKEFKIYQRVFPLSRDKSDITYVKSILFYIPKHKIKILIQLINLFLNTSCLDTFDFRSKIEIHLTFRFKTMI